MKKNRKYSTKGVRLPSNYWELYFDTIKQNWRTIFGIGLMSLLFFLPSLGFMFWRDYYFLQLTASNYSETEIDALRITSANYINIGVAVGLVLSSIGISGLSRLNLLVAREQGFFFMKDFNKGIRQNFVRNFVFFLIYGILIYCSLLVINNTNGGFVSYIPLGIVQVIFFPILLINIETTAIYSWRLKDSFRNSFIIFIKNFLVMFLFSLVFSSVYLLHLISYIFLKYIIYVALIVIIYPFVILALRVYMNRSLDKDINKEHYPEIYKMGIYEKQNEDYLNDVIKKYYGPNSTFNSVRTDPYLDTYFYHICSYISQNKETYQVKLMDQCPVWPRKAMVESLNYLRGLSYEKKLTYLQRNNYTVMGLRQDKKAKVAIVMAGGGYSAVCTLVEDTPTSVELHKKGMNVFSFSYPIGDKSKTAIDALKEFIAFLFKNEERMNIDMDDYMVIGCSAAGHLAALLGTDNLGINDYSKPKLLGLVYPVITMKEYAEPGSKRTLIGDNPSKEEEDKYSIELHVGKDYPNVFMWQSERDNCVPYENSQLMIKALDNSGIDYRFEHYDSDAHGWGVAKGELADGWVDRMYDYYLSLIENK